MRRIVIWGLIPAVLVLANVAPAAAAGGQGLRQEVRQCKQEASTSPTHVPLGKCVSEAAHARHHHKHHLNHGHHGRPSAGS